MVDLLLEQHPKGCSGFVSLLASTGPVETDGSGAVVDILRQLCSSNKKSYFSVFYFTKFEFKKMKNQQIQHNFVFQFSSSSSSSSVLTSKL